MPLDTNDNVSFILFGSPTFAKIDDLLRGGCFHTFYTQDPTSALSVRISIQEPPATQRWACTPLACTCILLPGQSQGCAGCFSSEGMQCTEVKSMHAGLDFAYPEAAKIGGLVSGPPQQGAGTAESPSGWVIAVERCTLKAQDAPAEEASTSGRDDDSSSNSPPGGCCEGPHAH